MIPIRQAIQAQIQMQNMQLRIADALIKEGIEFETIFDEFIIKAKDQKQAERAQDILKKCFDEETQPNTNP